MRVSEAVALDRQDVDLIDGILSIRRTKFGKSRYVPIHPSTVNALQKYANTRDCIVPAPPSPAFFLSERGTRITHFNARQIFAKLSQRIGLRTPAKSHGRGPRLHDMRHNSGTRIIPSPDRQGGLLREDRAIADATMTA
jgi:integrase